MSETRENRVVTTVKTALVVLAISAAVLLALTTCETLAGIGTSVAESAGAIDSDQADSIKRTSKAVAKSFEDFTPEQEYYIGRAVGANVVQKYPPDPDQKANDYLNMLGQSLAMASEKPETFTGYHFLLLDSEEINAFAAPSGFIFVSKGMLRCATDEDTLAAVLAHEIGHVQHNHGMQAIKKSRVTAALTSAALTAAEVAGPAEVAKLAGVFDDSILDITTTLMNSGYSREFEREADRAAVAILKRVGYDPRALISMLEVMDRRLKPGGLDFAKTHPDPKDRIKDIEKEIGDYRVTSSNTQLKQRRYREALGDL
jgi:predicted Zn-dependent protease